MLLCIIKKAGWCRISLPFIKLWSIIDW